MTRDRTPAQPKTNVDVHGYTATQRVLLYLFNHGVCSADAVGTVISPNSTRKRSPNGGGGDYAAQMMLGRMKSAGLVKHAFSEGSSLWELTPKGMKLVHKQEHK